MQKVIAWIDVEASGTTPEIDSLLEIAAVLTDFSGEQISDSYSSLVSLNDVARIMQNSSPIVKEMHETSGLWGDLWRGPTKNAEQIDEELLSFLQNSVDLGSVIHFGGNSPSLDRRFTELYFPQFYRRISHRSVDVTTLSLVLQESQVAPMFHKRGEHRALSDVFDSIDEYRHYLRFIGERDSSVS